MSKDQVKPIFIDTPKDLSECNRCEKEKQCLHIKFFDKVYQICKECLQEIIGMIYIEEGKTYILDKGSVTEQDVLVLKVRNDYTCEVTNTSVKWNVMCDRLTKK
ncbi:MAG: hypothetical protein ACOC1O_00680 [bacterium]